MHRGTTIQDAGYKQGTSWPFVADIQSARDCTKFIRQISIGVVPAMVAAYAAMYFLMGSSLLIAAIGPAVVAVLAVAMTLRFKKVRKDLLLNCKMIKLIAEKSGTDIDHAASTLFEAISRKGGNERIAALNDEFGVYVNVGYRMDDGRVESPYIIFIKKLHEVEDDEQQQAA